MIKQLNRLPSWLTTTVGLVLFYALIQLIISMGWVTEYVAQIVQWAGIMTISSLGLNLIYGFNGQFSLGHIAFYAIGAYTSALITKDWFATWSGSRVGALSGVTALDTGLIVVLVVLTLMRLGTIQKRLKETVSRWLSQFETSVISGIATFLLALIAIAAGGVVGWLLWKALPPTLGAILGLLPAEIAKQVVFGLALILGSILAAIIGLVVGQPLLKLASDYFGIATLGFAIGLYVLLQNSDKVIPTMKGARGMVGIPVWTNWFWVFICAALVIVAMRNLVYSSVGRAIISVREDEIAAKAMGIDVTRYKTVAFAIGSLFAGLAGGLFAHKSPGFLHPSSFDFIQGFNPLIVIVFGGLGSMTGTIVASTGWAFLLEGLRVALPQGSEAWRFVIYPVLLLIIMLLRPKGLLGGVEWWFLKPPKVQSKTEAGGEGE
jgi:branched-chain amino acid transport system permease protein